MKYGLLVLNEVLVQPLVAFNFEVDLFASWEPRLESLSMNDKVRVRHAHAFLKIPCDVKISIADLSLSMSMSSDS